MQAGGIELKAKSRQGSEQKTFEFTFTRMGGLYAVCKSVQEVHDTLKAWGITPLHNAVKEPDLRSEAEKLEDGIEYWEPLD